MSLKSLVNRVVMVGLAAGVVASAGAQTLTVLITSGVPRPTPIAIVPFGWAGSGEAPFDIARVVTADLGNSGEFEPMAVRDMVARPTRPADVRFGDWQIVDVDALLIGEIREDGPGRYSISFQLFDVLGGRQLLGFRLTAQAADLRATAHRISDMVYEELKGIPGIFSTRIAYVTENADAPPQQRYQLIVADADGENAQQITTSASPLMSPAWSPDGRRIAYVSFEDQQSAVYVQTVRTGTRERVSMRAGINGAPAFSPDGRRLALTLSVDGNLDIYTLDTTTQVLRRVTESQAIDTEPAWSADGREIFFTSDRAGGPQVYRVRDEPGGRAQRVTFEGNYNARPRVSPDGETLAVVHVRQGNYRIATVDVDSGLTNVLTRGSLDESPSFAPNGALIIYATQVRGRGVLASVSTDGQIQRQIGASAGDVREPVWGPFPRP